MKRFLRRLGGIKRLFFGILTFLAIFYLAQTLIFNASPRNNGETKSDHVVPSGNNSSAVLSDVGDTTQASLVENKAGLCDVDAVCPSSTLVFTVRSLRSNDNNDHKRPQFCINGQIVSSAPTAPKTISVVVVAGEKHVMEQLKHFDVSVDDKELRDLLVRLPYGSVIFLSSAGDVRHKVKEATRSVLRTQFGAGNGTLNSAAGFVFIGQKGLKPGFALEKSDKRTRGTNDVELRGCLQVPIGELEAPIFLQTPASVSSVKEVKSVRRGAIKLGPMVVNCGSEKPCSDDEFSVAVYSGKNKDDEPKICINDRMVMTRQLNKGGRGLNVVSLNATTREILRLGHFDTYAEESKPLEDFLEEMVIGEMVVVVSFDEASTHFSSILKQVFYELGSALVQNLKFRASWFLIGQKGISGFSPFEELNFASGNDWAKPVDRIMCVPPFLDGLRVRPDPIATPRNIAKRHFCEKYDGYEDFCEDSHIDDPIAPAPLVNRSMNGNPIFKVPILVVSGLSHNSLRLCLETLIHQPGIDPRFVLVAYDENYPESADLAHLFQFRSKAVSSSASYMTQLAKSFDALWEQYPDADTAIIIEEELLVTADFLYFMAQMLPILRHDQTILAISAWNINGYTNTSTLPDVVYRVEDFPGLAFMIRKDTYVKYMRERIDECCNNRAWEGWNVKPDDHLPIQIVPDVSRVIRRHIDGIGTVDKTVEELFHRQRIYSKMADIWISNTKFAASESSYDAHLRSLITQSILLNASVIQQCQRSSTISLNWIPQSNNGYVLYYDESKSQQQGLRLLEQLRRCFGLYFSETHNDPKRNDQTPKKSLEISSSDFQFWTNRGFYKGVLRFSYNGRPMFLIGTRSPFYYRPKEQVALANTKEILHEQSDRR